MYYGILYKNFLAYDDGSRDSGGRRDYAIPGDHGRQDERIINDNTDLRNEGYGGDTPPEPVSPKPDNGAHTMDNNDNSTGNNPGPEDHVRGPQEGSTNDKTYLKNETGETNPPSSGSTEEHKKNDTGATTMGGEGGDNPDNKDSKKKEEETQKYVKKPYSELKDGTSKSNDFYVETSESFVSKNKEKTLKKGDISKVEINTIGSISKKPSGLNAKSNEVVVENKYDYKKFTQSSSKFTNTITDESFNLYNGTTVEIRNEPGYNGKYMMSYKKIHDLLRKNRNIIIKLSSVDETKRVAKNFLEYYAIEGNLFSSATRRDLVQRLLNANEIAEEDIKEILKNIEDSNFDV